MKKLFNEFKAFIIQGNALNLAIGIILGSAFTVVVNSIVENLMMPPLGLLISSVNFQDLFLILKEGEIALPPNATLALANEVGAVTLNYGQFLTDVIGFILTGLGVFLIVKAINKLNRAADELLLNASSEKEEKPSTKDCPFCLQSIPNKATRCPFCTSQLED